MGKYNVKVSACTNFSCWNISTFADYLTKAGIKCFNLSGTEVAASDANAYVSVDDLLCLSTATSTYITNTLSKNVHSAFKKTESGTTSNYFTCLLSGHYTADCVGKVTIPFSYTGETTTLILPGTTPQFKKIINSSAQVAGTTYKMSRGSSGIATINNSSGRQSDNSSNTDYPDKVSPLFANVICCGAGGGGCSSNPFLAGGGGGSGALVWGIVDLHSGQFTFTIGSGGAGGEGGLSRGSGSAGTASTVSSFMTGGAGSGGSGTGGAGGTYSADTSKFKKAYRATTQDYWYNGAKGGDDDGSAGGGVSSFTISAMGTGSSGNFSNSTLAVGGFSAGSGDGNSGGGAEGYLGNGGNGCGGAGGSTAGGGGAKVWDGSTTGGKGGDGVVRFYY